MRWFINNLKETADIWQFVPRTSKLQAEQEQLRARVANLELVTKQLLSANQYLDSQLLMLKANAVKQKEAGGQNRPYTRLNSERGAYSKIKYLPAFRLAAALSEEGHVQTDIAKALNLRGCKTPRNKEFSQATVSVLLSNKFLQAIHQKETKAAKQEKP